MVVPPRLRAAARLSFLLVLCGAAGLHGDPPIPGSGSRLRARLERLIASRRPLALRLTIESAGPCPETRAVDGSIPSAICPSGPDAPHTSRAALELAADVATAAERHRDPEAIWTAALMDLLWADDAGIALDRSISTLRTAVDLEDEPAPVLADLSAALIARAGRRQNVRDLLEALEVAEQAIELRPDHVAARFNRAVALDRLMLGAQARWAWGEYLAVDSTSNWATEARRRLARTSSSDGPAEPPAPGASDQTVRAFVARSPQVARDFGWGMVLADWAAASIAGDAGRSARLLDLAEATGTALERRGGDATLLDAVRRIRKAGADPGATRALALGHRAYAEGQAAYREAAYAAAGRRFSAVLDLGSAVGGPLRDWAMMSRAATLVYEGRSEAAERMIRTVIARADPSRHPALLGRAHWALGTIQLWHGSYEEAWVRYTDAERFFARAGERENLGAVQSLAAEVEFYLGATPGATYASMFRSLRTLRSTDPAVWLHNLLYVMADALASDGMMRAAVRVQNEGVAVAREIGRPIYIAEAHLARARLLSVTRDATDAERDVRTASALVESLDRGAMRDALEADLRLTRALSGNATGGGRAVAALDSVVDHFSGTGRQVRSLLALIARSNTLIALGRADEATADLDRAIALLEEQRAAVSSARIRTSLVDQARRVFDRVVMLHVDAGRAAEALAYAERGRVAISAVGSIPVPARDGAGLVDIPPGGTAVEYGLIGDTLLIWTVSDAGIELVRTTIDRARFRRLVERTTASLEFGASRSVRADLAELHAALIAPIRSRLGPPGTPLVVVPDGEIHAVPFAALLDPEADRFLIEDHPLRVASSLRDGFPARKEVRPVRRHPVSVLAVADPAFDRGANPGLARLPAASAEAGAIAALYPEAALLAGSAALRNAITEMLDSATILHFAGHAIFDHERPERSYLVLAPAATPNGTPAWLFASEIEKLDLRHLRLVVLSACQTLRPTASRSGGFAGLAQAFLAAGTDGVVGSLWRVNDELTRALMVEFHRAYRASDAGADALREAQLRLLRSPYSRLRSPAAWAGFRYAGI